MVLNIFVCKSENSQKNQKVEEILQEAAKQTQILIGKEVLTSQSGVKDLTPEEVNKKLIEKIQKHKELLLAKKAEGALTGSVDTHIDAEIVITDLLISFVKLSASKESTNLNDSIFLDISFLLFVFYGYFVVLNLLKNDFRISTSNKVLLYSIFILFMLLIAFLNVIVPNRTFEGFNSNISLDKLDKFRNQAQDLKVYGTIISISFAVLFAVQLLCFFMSEYFKGGPVIKFKHSVLDPVVFFLPIVLLVSLLIFSAIISFRFYNFGKNEEFNQFLKDYCEQLKPLLVLSESDLKNPTKPNSLEGPEMQKQQNSSSEKQPFQEQEANI